MSQPAPLKKKSNSRPTALPSNRPVSKFRTVIKEKKKVYRDPRFDHLCGKFNEDLFKKSYEFVNQIKNKEIERMGKEAQKTKDPQRAAYLRAELNRESSRRLTEEKKQARLELTRKIKKEEREMVKKGKTPYYLKKSAMRQIELTEQFNKIADKSKLDKLLEKRRKHNATKEHKLLPFLRDQ